MWIIPGFDTLVLLRAKEGGKYSFARATYVHGIMKGEAMDGSIKKTKVNIE